MTVLLMSYGVLLFIFATIEHPHHQPPTRVLPCENHYRAVRDHDVKHAGGLPFPATYNPSLMETAFLDRLANQLKANKSATCRRAIQRILVRIKEHYESGQYRTPSDAETEFRRLVESDLACK